MANETNGKVTGGEALDERSVAAEKHLGRFLDANEIVHHKDGNRLNNDPANLMVLSASEHSLLHESLRRKI